MLHNCSYCDYQSPYKTNLRRHVKNNHTEKKYLEKDHGKTMKNDQHKEFKKLKILIKKFAILGVDLRLLKRSVDRLVEINENDYNFTVQEYENLTHQSLHNLFNTGEDILGNEETSNENDNVDLFANINEEEEAVNLFGEKIVKDEKKNAATADICQIRFFIHQNPCLLGGKILSLGQLF